jgi:metal-sulfur cluster biosynthetic enzyme
MTTRTAGDRIKPLECEAWQADVWTKLAGVTDPELDEPVTDMGFITGVQVDRGGSVAIAFRLPTYWCAPNFAFMMGHDMRAAIRALPWVTAVTVTLFEHQSVDEINRGVNEDLPFEVAFGDEANGNLDGLRLTFVKKAFQWRQEALISHLLREGLLPDELLSWTVERLQRELLSPDAASLVARYLDRRSLAGDFDGASPAFLKLDGGTLQAAELPSYLRSVRRLRTNAEFNGALCRGLLAERFSNDPLPPKRDAFIMPAAQSA